MTIKVIKCIKPLKKPNQRPFNRTALATVITLICAGYVHAETSEASVEAKDKVEQIVVTGSHIRRVTEARSPIDVLDLELMERQGATRIVDAVKFMPANTGSFLTQEAGALTGTSQFNIRGLGAGSSLTLINGKRGGKSPMADGNGNQFFDLNQLPLSMILRLDVQKDGASATYGSDAVGGVVNIITRKGFEGFEFSAKAEDASNEAYSFGLASGKAFDRGTVNVYAGYYQQTRNIRTDFDFIDRRINGDGNPVNSVMTSGTGGPGTYRQAILDETGNYVETIGDKFADPNCEAAGGILKDGLCRHSFADQLSIIPEEKRFQVFAEADYDLSEPLRLYTELSYSHNKVNATIAPQLFRNGLAAGNLLIPADHPFNFFVSDGADGIDYIAPENWDNSIHTGVALNCSCRPLGVEFNGYDSEFDRVITLDYLRGMTGFAYEFDNAWFLDTSFVYSRATRDESEGYNYKKAELNGAVNDGRFNPFGSRNATPNLVSPKDGVSVAGLSRDVLMDFMHFRQTDSESEQSVVDVVVGGDWFELEGGAVGVALGSQYRKDTLLLTQDPLWAAGLSRVPETTDERIEGSQDVVAVFAEMLLPVAKSIEVAAAIRYEDYGGGVGATTDPKISARWQATDALALRSSYGTSFQVPSVSQASSSNGQSFLNDPVSVNANGDIVCQSAGLTSNSTVIVQGSASLKPQSAKNFNGGVMFHQKGFEWSMDYWHFDYQNLIRPDGSAQAIVDNDCVDGVPDDPRVVRSSSGQIRSVTLSFINTGDVVTDGLDFMVGYRFTDTARGDFGVKLAASYVNKFALTTINIDGSQTITEGAGNRNFSNPFSSVPRWRSNLGLNWAYNNHAANAAVRYIANYNNDQLSVPDDIASWVSFDVGYSYDLSEMIGQDTMLNIGVNNVFDREPPTLGQDQRPGYDANVHDVRGRTAYIGVKFAM